MDYLMDIDIGTTNIKAMIFDAKGNEISRCCEKKLDTNVLIY
jgi:sugar (pentulose or hexulose) kinase